MKKLVVSLTVLGLLLYFVASMGPLAIPLWVISFPLALIEGAKLKGGGIHGIFQNRYSRLACVLAMISIFFYVQSTTQHGLDGLGGLVLALLFGFLGLLVAIAGMYKG